MRILRYWKKVPVNEWLPSATYDIVPIQEVRDDITPSRLFDIILKAVRASDFTYVLIVRTETLEATNQTIQHQ